MEWFIIAILYLGIGDAQAGYLVLTYAADREEVPAWSVALRLFAWPAFTIATVINLLFSLVTQPRATIRAEDQSRLDI